MPGTPSRHLPLAATKASKRISRASIGSAAKLLIASTTRPRPWRWQTSATAASGFATPAPVSQWISTTWLIDGSAISRASSAAAETGSSSGKGSTLQRRPIICVSLLARLQ